MNQHLLYLKYLGYLFLIFITIPVYSNNQDSIKVKQYLTKLNQFEAKNIDSLAQLVSKASAEFKSAKNEYGLYKVKAEAGFLLSKFGYYHLGINYYLEALKHAEKLEDKTHTVKVLNAIGAFYGRKGDVNNAELYLLKARLLANKINYVEGQASAYLKLGALRTNQGLPKEALKFYEKIDSLNNKYKTNYFVNDCLANKGIIYAINGKLDFALQIFNSSYNYAVSENRIIDQILALQNIGLVYKEKGNYEKAISNFNQGIALANKKGLTENKIKIAINIPTILLLQNKKQEAFNYALALLNEAKKIELESAQIEIQQLVIEIAKSQNNFEIATKHLEELSEIKNKLYKQETNKALAEAAVELELFKTQRDMQSTVELLFETKKERNAVVLGILILVALLLGLGVLLMRIKKLNAKLNKNKTQLISSNNNKNKLFSIIGHDLRSAYSSTLGVLGLIKSGDLDKEEQEIYLDKVINQSKSALATLDDLLLWGHAQIKGKHLLTKEINPFDNVEKIISFYREQLEAKNIVLKNLIPSEINVYMDENHFAFILRNLISNAIKFTPNNGLIEINAYLYEKYYIKFCVKDSGNGIEEDKLEAIFLPESTSTDGTNKEKGTGLGLTLCKEFAETNGGEIWAENHVDGGAIICFTSKKS